MLHDIKIPRKWDQLLERLLHILLKTCSLNAASRRNSEGAAVLSSLATFHVKQLHQISSSRVLFR